MFPQPKKKRIKLTGADYHRLRYEAFFRAAGCCEMPDKGGNRCGRWAPFDSENEVNGELSHYPRVVERVREIL